MNRFLSLLSAFLLPVTFSSLAQTQKQVNKHNVFWHKTEINEIFAKEGKGFGIGADFVFRSKSTFEDPSPFAETNRIGFRPWLHYQFSPYARLSLSPIGFKYTDDYKAQASDFDRAPYEERRITLQFFHHKKSDNGKFMSTWRYRYEWRWQETATGDWRYFNRLRFRYRLRYIITGNDFYENNTLYAAVNNEIGINIGRNVPYMFNQNRFYLAMGYRFMNSLRAELRYVNRYRARGATGLEYDNGRGVMLMFYIDQLSLVGKKKVQEVRFAD